MTIIAHTALLFPIPPPDQGEVRWGLPEFDEDRLEDAIQIRQHFLVPNSHYTISACRNYSGPLVILSYARRIGVL